MSSEQFESLEIFNRLYSKPVVDIGARRSLDPRIKHNEMIVYEIRTKYEVDESSLQEKLRVEGMSE
jgi:hypothetical protein